jgi:hypothetical protein
VPVEAGFESILTFTSSQFLAAACPPLDGCIRIPHSERGSSTLRSGFPT